MQRHKLMYYAEFRLKVWGRWANKAIIPELGYPSSTTEFKLRDTGGILAVSTSKLSIPINTDADEIEQIVKELLSHRSTIHLGLVLRAQYIAGGSVQQKARLIKVSTSRFRSHLVIARRWVADRLASHKRGNQPADKHTMCWGGY